MKSILMISSLILQLARGIWFIEPASAAAYKPVVEAILSGKNIDFGSLMPKAYKDADDAPAKKPIQFAVSMSLHKVSRYNNVQDAPAGSIAVTPLNGVVMKNDFCGASGTQTLAALMRQADNSPNISAHILMVDSPGGSADAMFGLAETIKSLDKPVLTFSDGMMASAAYGIGSSAKHIMASNNMNNIGSIGTYMTVTDYRKADEMKGIKETTVYATKSTEKNAPYNQAIDGNTKPLQEYVDKYNEAFLSVVKRNRYGKNLDQAQTLKGQLHFTPEALQYGLIDSVGTFADAVTKVKSFIK